MKRSFGPWRVGLCGRQAGCRLAGSGQAESHRLSRAGRAEGRYPFLCVNSWEQRGVSSQPDPLGSILPGTRSVVLRAPCVFTLT